MSRKLSADLSRSARRADTAHPLNHRKSLQAKLQTTPFRSSPLHRTGSFKSGPPSARSASSVGGSPRPFFNSDDDLSSSGEENDDLGSQHIPGIKLPVPTLAMTSRKPSRTQNGKKPTKIYSNSKKDRLRAERKASVRKERFEELDTDSDLTDMPSDDEVDETASTAGPSYSGLEKGKARSLDSNDLQEDSDSDSEMERKLAEAGDGESLLGSGASGDDTEEEEERFIIQDALDRQSKAKARLQHRDPSDRRRHGSERDSASRSDLQYRARSIAIRRGSTQDGQGATGEEAEADVEDDDDDDEVDEADLLSMSPDTLRMYGLPVIEDELFEEQEAFNSSSEPSFTDFFETSSDSEAGEASALNQNGDDDDEFTTDSDEDRDISDLEGGLLDAPLIAHIGTAADGEQGEAVGDVAADGTVQPRPEMPLLVIEDLDGRLIYARAGDGEAVFGSDGEFEFVDDSDDDSADWEFDQGGNRLLSGASGLLGAPGDDGDTTDELPDEDMPYPRLLVGSVAPRGGRNARRARAMATNSRRLSPAAPSSLPSPSLPLSAQAVPASDSSVNGKLSGSVSGASPVSSDEQASNDVGITISTEELARDPEGTLRAAAAALGVTMEEAATLLAGVQLPAITGGPTSGSISSYGSGISSVDSSMAAPKTPEQHRVSNVAKPQMGSFMPTSAKSVHRAVIDGSRKAPSPFSGKRSLERKGLAKKRSAARRSSLMDEGLSAKRLRRFSSANDAASALDEYSELAPSSPEPIEEVDPMELDDVVDSSMIWRGTGSKSPSPEAEGADGQGEGRRPSARLGRKVSSAPGLNLNAFARWNKIPMGSFRDSQAAIAPSQNAFQQQHQHQQPLGTFLLTRSQGQSGNRAGRTSSPFRSSSNAVRHPEMFSISPLRQPHENTSNEAGRSNDSTLGRRRSFIISPVLFPTRGGEIPPPSSNFFATPNAPTYSQIAGLHLGGGNAAGDAASIASGNSAGPGRITRREKREKRAKRAAMLAALGDEGAAGTPPAAEEGRPASASPMPTTPLLQLSSLPEGSVGCEEGDSPATAFPRMRITDATPTPRGSPVPNCAPVVGKDLLQPGSNLNPHIHVSKEEAAQSHNVPSESMQSCDSPRGMQVKDQDASISTSMSGALPSSACKTPLHSPLFGGILGGALQYDLEKEEAEHLRI
ncbi:uncharacterized protein MEPE_01342 [Melanopsichium pennsylvanicum]|uniref:Uncharacterized protein n=2 Tax=Melanopsichium pennsylvanicum TaxID=63383 RepID=A0AAJ5C3H4_9BASI|nr:conserved hypothetical protein [Melanopsichium pennsylvanicum 4]SNX82636.1 uncharacterized protein MEPE_01342 [Melanopsichium pennsylvanicum]